MQLRLNFKVLEKIIAVISILLICGLTGIKAQNNYPGEFPVYCSLSEVAPENGLISDQFNGVLYFADKEISFIDILQIESLGDERSQSTQIEQLDLPVRIFYDIPNLVYTGDTFEMILNIEKGNYSIPGSIKQILPSGFRALSETFSDLKYNITGNEVFISWPKIITDAKILISFPVEVRQLTSGIYPILSQYSDENGLRFNINTWVEVKGEKYVELPDIKKPVENPFKLNLQYPPEVEPGSEYDMEIGIKKGASTDNANLEIKLPPGVEIIITQNINFKYDQSDGLLKINWDKLPETPEIKINCKVNTSGIKTAVYPVYAEFFINNKKKVAYFKNIYIKSEKPEFTADRYSQAILQSASFDTLKFPPKNDLESIEKNSAFDSLNNNPVSNPVLQIVFRVQIEATQKRKINMKNYFMSLGIFEQVYEDYNNGIYRYSVGTFNTFEEADVFLKKIKNKGFGDAFIVEYKSGTRIKAYY